MLETRGYADAVVTITDESADVVVGMSVLSDAQCAQIEDIVARKTGIAAQNIVIKSTLPVERRQARCPRQKKQRCYGCFESPKEMRAKQKKI